MASGRLRPTQCNSCLEHGVLAAFRNGQSRGDGQRLPVMIDGLVVRRARQRALAGTPPERQGQLWKSGLGEMARNQLRLVVRCLTTILGEGAGNCRMIPLSSAG